MNCINFRKYEGTKSQKIQQMINEKLQAKKEKELGNVNEIPEVKQLISNIREVNVLIKKMHDEIKRVNNKYMLDIYWNGDSDRVSVHYESHNCIVPKKTIDLLQMAQTQQSLGNSRAAKKIWDKVMQEYEIGQMPSL
jgi:hypothetical protein